MTANKNIVISHPRRVRVPKLPRESAAIVLLRQKGQPVQNISAFLGRSTSFVQRVLEFNNALRRFRFADLRKLPRRVKDLGAKFRRREMEKLGPVWLSFILGETDKPP